MPERVPGCIGGFVDTWNLSARKKRGRPAGSTSTKRQKIEDKYDTEAPFDVMFPDKTVRIVKW